MARYISTIGTASVVTKTVTSDITCEVNDRLLVDTSGGAVTVTLPASTGLLINDTVQFLDVAGTFGTNNLTVGRNGANIQSLAEDLVLDISNTAATIVYTGTTYGWVLAGT